MKGRTDEVKNRSKDLDPDVPGYDTYWALNDGGGAQTAGLNGVATFVRRGGRGAVRRANAAPLGQPELDAEGRCLMTDHGEFVIFNVYVRGPAQALDMHSSAFACVSC